MEAKPEVSTSSAQEEGDIEGDGEDVENMIEYADADQGISVEIEEEENEQELEDEDEEEGIKLPVEVQKVSAWCNVIDGSV